MPIYAQVPIRIEASLVSNPPVNPTDANTGQQIKFWRGQTAVFQIGIFDVNGVAVDLSNLDYLQLVLQAAPDSTEFLFQKTVLAGAITPTITRAAWLNGSAQQAAFALTQGETDQSLGGSYQQDFWIVLQGKVTGGDTITYAAGYVTLFNSSSALPAPPLGYVSENSQTNTSGNATISPTSLDHTESLTVNGSAGTRSFILSTVGMSNGALLRLRLNLTSTPSIVMNIYSGSLSGTQVTSFTTGSALSALLTYVYDATAAAWTPISYAVPAV